MKKKILSVLFVLTLSFVGTPNTSEDFQRSVECDEYAADHLAVHESYFGCLDSYDYNYLYDTIRVLCERSQME